MYVIAWIGLISCTMKGVCLLVSTFIEERAPERINNFIGFIFHALMVYFFAFYLFLM